LTPLRVVTAVVIAELLALSVWFSASAVVPALTQEWNLSTGDAAWLTMAVQLGFVVGALLSAAVNLPDRVAPRWVFAGGALMAAATNAAVPLWCASFGPAVALRFGTGMSLALVYPVGMKIVASWEERERGLALGLLVGALTVGSALPHLLKVMVPTNAWQMVMLTTSGLALVAAAIGAAFGGLGPHVAASAPFRWNAVSAAWRDPALRCANIGYLGHMWELYAFWSWIGIWLAHFWQDEARIGVTTFAVIAIGSVGCLAGGYAADRIGRTAVTIASLLVSGVCCLLVGAFAHADPNLLTAVLLVWGFAVVADSAQFSASVSELADRSYVGTALSVQAAMGFLLTLVSIRLVPVMAEVVGWEWCFAFLALGPMLGGMAMFMLRQSSDAAKLAGGRR